MDNKHYTLTITREEFDDIIDGLEWYINECWKDDVGARIASLRNILIERFERSAEKQKTLDDLAKEAEESRAAYKRWKEEQGGKGKGKC